MSRYQSVKSFYDAYWTKRTDNSSRYRYKIFRSWIVDGAKVLDVGCGDGYLSDLLAREKKCEVTCLDISEVALAKARERGLKTVLASAEEPLPFGDNSFDYVIATEIIEHVPFSEQVITELARVSKNYILLSIPNVAFWKYRLQLLMGRFPRQWAFEPYEHLRFWSVKDFKETLSSLSLDLVELKAGSGKRYIRDWWPNLFAEQVCFKLSKHNHESQTLR